MRSTEDGVWLIDERHEEFEDDLAPIEHEDGSVSVLAEVHGVDRSAHLEMVKEFLRSYHPGAVLVDITFSCLRCYHGERLVELTYIPATVGVHVPAPRAEQQHAAKAAK